MYKDYKRKKNSNGLTNYFGYGPFKIYPIKIKIDFPLNVNGLFTQPVS